MSIACWITKVTSTHSEYVTLIDFPLQQLLHEWASVLCYTHTACQFSSTIARPADFTLQGSVPLILRDDKLEHEPPTRIPPGCVRRPAATLVN
jgi:hypothetical protein